MKNIKNLEIVNANYRFKKFVSFKGLMQTVVFATCILGSSFAWGQTETLNWSRLSNNGSTTLDCSKTYTVTCSSTSASKTYTFRSNCPITVTIKSNELAKKVKKSTYYDHLYVYDANSDSSQKADWKNGSSNPSSVTCSSGYARIKFERNDNVSDNSSFTFTVTCECPCEDPNFSLSSNSGNVDLEGTINLAELLQNTHGATPTYRSNNTSIASVTNAGVVTGVAAGTTTIRVNIPEITVGGTKYCAAEATYTVTVNSCTSRPDDAFKFAATSIESPMGSMVTPPTLTNTTGFAPTYSSSNTSIATVNASTGAVTPISDGTTTITATIPASGRFCEKSASYQLTITCEAAVITFMDDNYIEETQTLKFVQGNGIKYPNIRYNGTALPAATTGTSSNTSIATTANGIIRVNTTNVGSSTVTLHIPTNGPICKTDLTLNILVACEDAEINMATTYFSNNKFTVTQGTTGLNNLITYNGSNRLPNGTTCTSSNTSIATLSNSYIFTINSRVAGTAHVVMNIPANDGYCEKQLEFDVEVTCTEPTLVYETTATYTQQTNAEPFAYTITYNGEDLPENTTGTSTNPSIATVENGAIMVNKGGIGTAVVNLDIPANAIYCATTATVTINVQYDCTQSNVIGTGTTTTQKYAPIYTETNKYSYTQQLYTAAEVATAIGTTVGTGARQINKIAFQLNGSTNLTSTISVSLGNTGTANLSTSWITDITKVVSNKSYTFRSGWNEIELENPFIWDGTSNLVVVVYTTSKNSSTTPAFVTTSKSTYTRYAASSSSFTLLNKVPRDNSGTKTDYRPNIKFCTVPQYTLIYTECTTEEYSCSGAIVNMPAPQYGMGRIILTSSEPTCTEKTFTEWNTEADGSGDHYQPGDVFNLTSNATLYAVFKDCSDIASSSISAPYLDSEIPYYSVCLGNSVELKGTTNIEEDIRDWKWRINAHDGNAPTYLHGQNVTYTPSATTGNDITLYVTRDSDGCISQTSARIKVSNGLRPNPNMYDLAEPICIGGGEDITIGDSEDFTIRVEPEEVTIKAVLRKGETTFIPDGPYCLNDSYQSSVTFYDFASDATITRASNIDFIKLNIEHSFIGDLQIKITCPNGQEAIILEDFWNNADGGKDDYSYIWPYSSSSGGHPPIAFGDPAVNRFDGSDVCDPDSNTPGRGETYCWSESSTINGRTVTYAGNTHSYAWEKANHEKRTNNQYGYTSYTVKPSNVDNLTQFYKPKESFYEKLQGCPLNGTWTITVSDNWFQDNGYIFDWELSLNQSLIPDPWTYRIELANKRIEDCDAGVSTISEDGIHIQPNDVSQIGRHTCNLILTDNHGCESTPIPISYEIYDAVKARIVTDDEVCVGENATISVTANGAIEYTWGDGLHANQDNFTTQIFANAQYTVTATNHDGCYSNASADVNIKYPITGTLTGDFVWSGQSLDWHADNNWFMYNADNDRYTLQSGPNRQYPTTTSNVYIAQYYDCVSDPKITLGNHEANAHDLYVGDGITLYGSNQNFNINGNVTLNGSASFQPQTGAVTFGGDDDQTITNDDGQIFKFNDVKFDQSEEGYFITAENNMQISGKATFTTGIVGNTVTFTSTGQVLNGDNLTYRSFVNDTVTKIAMTGSFIFPVGNDFVLGSVSAKNGSSASKVSAVFRHKADPTGFTTQEMPKWWGASSMCSAEVNGSEDLPRIAHASNAEYWKINSPVALSDIKMVAHSKEGNILQFNENTEEYSAEAIVGTMYNSSSECWQNMGGSATVESTGRAGSNNRISLSGISLPAGNGAFFTFGSKDGNTILPIEISEFYAECNGDNVATVYWATETETDNDYFVLERSHDAINFTEIARIQGAGYSTETKYYNFVDNSIYSGDNYYRLVQVDYDGSRTTSEIITIMCNEGAWGEPNVEAYPNPFNNEITVVLENFGNVPAQIEIFDMLGKLVKVEKIESTIDEYTTTYNFSNLANGTYNMRVSTSDIVIVKQIIKQ